MAFSCYHSIPLCLQKLVISFVVLSIHSCPSIAPLAYSWLRSSRSFRDDSGVLQVSWSDSTLQHFAVGARFYY